MPLNPTQACPNCQTVHDVGVYVSGQKVRCKCGIQFAVLRTDVSSVGSGPRPQATFVGRGGNGRAAALQVQPDPALPQTVGAPADKTFVAQAARMTLPGYELKELLGKGGMGEVWRATQLSLGRQVAVKLLPPNLAKDPEFIHRFEKESAALAALSHPNIIQIIDRGSTGENYYFVMEFVQGRSLRELVSDGPLSPVRAVKIVSEICAAIDYAHDQNIIHRDLKPENILLDSRGHVKVADFGLAGMKGHDAKLQLTATAVAMGTINYMAPEQRRDAKNVDGRADLFSLGVILYELLTGELPVGRFELPSNKIPGLDTRLDDIIERALAQDPAGRYERASLVGAELHDVLTQMSAVSGVTIDLEPPGETRVSSRRTPAAAAASHKGSVIQSGWKGIQLGLLVVGAIAVIGFGIKFFGSQTDGKELLLESSGLNVLLANSSKAFPENTFGELFANAVTNEDGDELTLSFDPGKEEINAHAGTWTLDHGTLKAIQGGSDADGRKLVPRAYIAHRYFLSDDFTAEATLRMKRVGDEYAFEENTQQFAELAFRIKDLQVSIFAIPKSGMRLMWRYYLRDGTEKAGNSALDLENMIEDEMPVPPFGQQLRLKLVLKKRKNGVDVEAFANGQRFVKKFFEGLDGQVGKIAVGCRNLECEFF